MSWWTTALSRRMTFMTSSLPTQSSSGQESIQTSSRVPRLIAKRPQRIEKEALRNKGEPDDQRSRLVHFLAMGTCNRNLGHIVTARWAFRRAITAAAATLSSSLVSPSPERSQRGSEGKTSQRDPGEG